jgi:hypothetical protein
VEEYEMERNGMGWVDRLLSIMERELKDGGNTREVEVKSKKGG